MYICTCLCIAGKDEELGDKLRSILAQLEFSHTIDKWDQDGVPFKTHLYVPEVHPLTGHEFCERGDEGHVFKVSLDIVFIISGCDRCYFFLFPCSVLVKA